MRRAFCFDLDGTVTTQEILPLISRELDLFDEINLLTQLTLSGQIPFQSSFKLRVRILSSVPISKVNDIVDTVMLNDRIVDFIQSNKDDCYIVTGNLDVWVGKLIEEKIQCKYFCSNANYEGEQLNSVEKILDKKEAVKALAEDYDQIIVIGDLT